MSMPRIFALIPTVVLALHAGAFAQDTAQAAPKEKGKLPMVAVLPLDARGLTTEEASVMTDMLGSELLQTGAFRVMERSQMDKILAEQGFQKSGACDNSQCAVEMGQLLGIDNMVVGSIGKVGRTFLVNARMVSVGSGEILRSISRTTTGDVDDILTRMLPIVASELANRPVETVRHPLLPPSPQARADSTSVAPAPVRSAAAPAKAEEKGSSVGAWVLGALLVGGAGGGAWYFLKGPGSESQNTSTEPASRSAVFSWNP